MNAPLFDPIASIYDRTRLVPPDVLEEMYDCIFAVSALRPAARVLDCGIGTGLTVEPLLRRGAVVIGIDVAPEMLAILADKIRGAAWPVGLARASAHAAPFRGRSFDVAMMVNVAHLISDWRAEAAEIERLVRPGGHFVVAFRRPSAAESRLTQKYFALQRRSWSDVVSRASVLAIRKLGSRAGRRGVGPRWERALLRLGTLVEQRTWTWDEELLTRDVVAWLDRRYLSYQSQLPEPEHRRIMNDISTRAARGPAREWIKGKLVLSVFRLDGAGARKRSA